MTAVQPIGRDGVYLVKAIYREERKMTRWIRAAGSPTGKQAPRRDDGTVSCTGGAPGPRGGSPAWTRGPWPTRAGLGAALCLAMTGVACAQFGAAHAASPTARAVAARAGVAAGSAPTGSVTGTPPTPISRSTAAAVAADPGRRAAGPPAFFIGLSDPNAPRQGVAVFNTRTGRLVRYLTPQQPGGGASYPLLDPAGRSVVYAVGTGSCGSDIYRVSVDGPARPQLLIRGDSGPLLAPAVAPGGGRIAYVQGHCDAATEDILARPLTATGPAVALYRGAPAEGISGLRWSQDGWLSFITTTGQGAVLHTIPARDGQPVRSLPAPTGCSWSAATWFSDDGRARLLASLDCAAGSRWLILDRQLATLRTLATFPAQRGAQSVSVDATNKWLIYQENDASMAGGIWRWMFTSASHPIPITAGPNSPSWH